MSISSIRCKGDDNIKYTYEVLEMRNDMVILGFDERDKDGHFIEIACRIQGDYLYYSIWPADNGVLPASLKPWEVIASLMLSTSGKLNLLSLDTWYYDSTVMSRHIMRYNDPVGISQAVARSAILSLSVHNFLPGCI